MGGHLRRTKCWSAIVLALCTGVGALESPADLLAMKMNTQLLQTEGTMTGEGVCWHASWRAGDFVRGARQSSDLAYLDGAQRYFDALMGKLHTSPDGRKGWVGPYIYDESVIADVHIGDAILVNHMLAFALYVRSELPEDARASYAEGAQAYVELAEHIVAKWVDRGTWYENGHYGGYISWDHFLRAEDLTQFQRRDDVRTARLSLPFNKQQSMGILHLRLHRLTGDEEHLRKARLIFQYTRSRMSHFEDVFTWNYWEPFYPGDVVSAEPARLAHWVATHPYRDYQRSEVSEFVEAYHYGLVFSRADMLRLARTNLRMWNGNAHTPIWVNSDLPANRAAVPEWTPPDPAQHGYPRSAGTLWQSLVEFDSTLASLAGREATNPGYVRRHDTPEGDFDWPAPQVTYLNLGCVLPATVAAGERAWLVNKARAPGHLRVLLSDATGEVELQTLFEVDVTGGIDGVEGLTIREWTADVTPGEYRIRWVFTTGEHNEHRDYPIVVE